LKLPVLKIMNRHDVNWTGYIPAVTTPFTRDGDLDLPSLAVMMEWYVEQRMHGVVLAGTSGEWFSLSEGERAELFLEAGRAINKRITVLGGCNAYSAKDAIVHANAAARAGLDGILLTPPPYIVPTRREIVQFYKDVSDATDMPICAYNWPRGCVVDMDEDLIDEIADIDKVVAIKNSTPDIGAFLRGAYRVRDKIRYFNLPPNELGADLAMLKVADGSMGAGAVLGSDHPDFFRCAVAGNKADALRLARRDQMMMQDWVSKDFAGKFGNLQAILKTALRFRGLPAGYVRKPLLELSSIEVETVRQTLEKLGIDIVPIEP
jgi:dihydrodipicolinate synthase/N-acetylneuraminate lyase